MKALGLWYLRRWQRHLTVPFVAALVLFIASGLVYVRLVIPVREQISEISVRLALSEPSAMLQPEHIAPPSATEQLVRFYAFFPQGDRRSDVLDRIFAAAAKENLALPQGEYQWNKEATGSLIRYGILFPIKGTYPAIRRFMAQVLQENPSLSLDSAVFGRQTAGSIGVDAQIHFTLYLKSSES
ncbi:MAG: hypothetical protein QM739_08455 [Propionivibrio sp.]